jgi:endothelin-converting enzyme/putative endopeptidase
MTPAINWNSYFTEIDTKLDTVIVAQPKYMSALTILSENNVSAWNDI